MVLLEVKEELMALGNGEAFIRSKIFLINGKVARVSIVLLFEFNGKMECVLRYDCSHGFLHRDLCYKKPPVKERVDEILDGGFVEKVKKDLMKNWRKYLGFYGENHG